MNGILAGILGTIGLFLGFAAAPATPFFGNGSGTINQLSPFTVSSNQVRLASTTANFRIPSLTSKDCVGTDSNGVLQEGTCTGGAGSSVGTVSTSSLETAGHIPYWTTTSGYPAKLTSLATTTLTASSPLALSNPVFKVGGSNSVLTLDTSGTWTGNAGTASALAANGANCSAGSFPLGVDASGAAETCTDAWTEAENTSAAYISLTSLSATAPIRYNSGTGAFTWLGLATTSQPSSSQLLVSNGSTGVFGVSTSTLSATSPLTGSFVQVGSGGTLGIQNAAADGSTKGAASFTALDFDATTGNISIDYTNGQAASASAKGFLTSTNWSLFNNKVSTTSIDTITEVETLWGVTNILIENDIDASTELAAIMDDETGTAGNLVFSGSPTITSPTLSTFFGTPCTGQNFLQDISDTGAFTCGAASGSSGNMSGWATTTPYGSQLLLYPVDAQTTDVAFGTNSTTTAPFWWDVSATSTYIGNGGTGSSTIQFGSSGFEWLMGFDGSDNSFKISSSTVERGFSVSNVLSIAKSTLLSTFNFAVTIVGNLTLSANLIFDGQTFDSLTDDATLTNNAGDLQVVDVNCTDCLGTTEIADSYLLNNGDVGTGTFDLSGATVKQHTYSSFTYASTTAWTGTTTIPLGPAYTAESWSGVKCFTDVGTLNVDFNDGTNRMNLLNASTTVGSFTFSTNNTFTASEKRYVEIGTPASSPTKISCTVDKIVNN